ncbi:helix-turn-helix transcriptional regulator [Devosia sp. A369]
MRQFWSTLLSDAWLATGGLMTLLERATQFEQLNTLLTAAISGRGGIAAVCGEAGAGKTSLVAGFAGAAAGIARVLRSACEDLSVPDPLGPLYDLAREANWTLVRSGADRQGLSLFSDALEAFQSDERPTLLLIEDLHWADEATLDFVRFVGRRIVQSNIVLVLTARTDSGDGQRRLRRALAGIPADHVLRIDIPLLTQSAVAELVHASGGDAQTIYRATAGNPFFVTELLRAGSDTQLPPNVRDMVLARAEHLSPGARRALDAVSVFPRQAEATVLRMVYGAGSAAPLAECVASGMLEDLGQAFAFRHEIARDAVALALAPSLRRDLNGRVLAALRAGDGVPVARLVHHALEANDAAAVAKFAPLAAAEASRVGAHRQAAAHYETALKQADSFNVDARADLLERYAFECHLLGKLQDAVDAASRACQLRQGQGDRLKEGDGLRWLSRYSYVLGDRAAADQYGLRAIELLETVPPGPERAMAYSNQSQLAMLGGDVEETLRHGAAAIRLAETFGRADIVCHALNNIGTSEAWTDVEQSRQHLDRSLQLALDGDLQEHAARAFTNSAWMEIGVLAFPRAAAFLKTGIEYCVEHDIDTWRDYMRGWRAELFLRQGNWSEADAAASEVLGNEDATPLMRYPAATVLARLRIRRGDQPTGELMAELSRYLEKGMELQRLAAYAVVLAEQAWVGQGDSNEALRQLKRAQDLATSRALFGELTFWRHLLAPDTPPGDTTGMAAPYRLYFAGDWRAGAAKWSALGAPYDQALALLGGDEAAQHEALAIFQSLGANTVVQHVRRLMRRRGLKRIGRGPSRTTRANQAGLTEREMEVLHLLGRGCSNKAIAAQLDISPKTVDHHVTALLGKLDVASRGEATARARDVGLI